MAKFSKGDPVYYVPDHAEDDPNEWEPGIVVSEAKVSPSVNTPRKPRVAYQVSYQDGSPNAKLTYERNLKPRDASK